MNFLKKLIFLFFSILSFSTTARAQQHVERKGFIFGAAAGISPVKLSSPSVSDKKQVGFSVPNFKVGGMVSPRLALVLYLPGTVYTQKWSGRTRDRGFEGIVPSAQFWATDRFWVLGGAGLGMDAPAFYDIKNASERKFYFGGAVLASAGFEIFQRRTFAVDVQGRVHFGTAKIHEETMKNMAVSLLLGINFY